MSIILDDRKRWLKFGSAVGLLVALGALCGVGVPIIRPSVLRYETRADEFAGRRFALDYGRVHETYHSFFTLDVDRGAGLRVTVPDSADRALLGAPRASHDFAAPGVQVTRGDSVSMVGVFRAPNLFVLSDLRTHPRRRLKYATAVPALLLVVWMGWRRLRVARTGVLLLRRRREEG